MQGRIDAGFARELVEREAVVLGLDGPSELVREGLRLLHRRGREMDVAAAYDEFYSGRQLHCQRAWLQQTLSRRWSRSEAASGMRAGDHPVVVLTINVLIPRLSAVTVAVVAGTDGPAQRHIPVDSESGLTGYDVSYVNATGLRSVGKSRLRRRRGRLHPRELARLEEAIRVRLGF